MTLMLKYFLSFELANSISACITLLVTRPTVKLIVASMNMPEASVKPACPNKNHVVIARSGDRKSNATSSRISLLHTRLKNLYQNATSLQSKSCSLEYEFVAMVILYAGSLLLMLVVFLLQMLEYSTSG